MSEIANFAFNSQICGYGLKARCSDVVRVGRGHVRGGVVYLPPQQKTGTPLVIPITAALAAAIKRRSTERARHLPDQRAWGGLHC